MAIPPLDPESGTMRELDLAALITHAEWVPARLRLGELVDRLGQSSFSYVAVRDGDHVVGVVSRETIGLLLGGRYGYALFGEEEVTARLEPDFLAFRRSTPLLEVLNTTLNRKDRGFQSDVVLLDDDGAYLGMIPVHRLARLQSRLLEEHAEELEIQKERYQDLVENANDIIFTVDLSGRFLSLNKAGERLTGYAHAEATTMSIFDVIVPEHHALTRQMTNQKLSGAPRTTYEVDIMSRGGHRLTLEVSSRPLLQEDIPVGIQGIARDITERRIAESRLRYNALHDALTGLPNRILFSEQLESAIERQKRNSSYQFAVLLLDLDRFKVVNDSLGHIAGDRLLVVIAERLKNSVRGIDTVARFGGDEFTVLLDGILGMEDAVIVTERIMAEFAKPIPVFGQEIFTSASIGIAFSSYNAKAEELLRDADMAMYHAKSAGNAAYQVFNPEMHQRAATRLSMETDLRRAIDRNEFELHYQPIVDLSTLEIVEFEALLRWRHPVRGVVLPALFIPLAEETGMIQPLGQWVIREACRQLRQWQEDGLNDRNLVMSVNLSVRELSRGDLVGDVASALAEFGLPARQLNLEITESAIVENEEGTRTVLRRLKEIGVLLSMDDFGTGYSSLSFLHGFRMNRLKIDRSFINSAGSPGEHREIVRTIVTLGRSLGMEVVAEGVETTAQLTFLEELGCQYAQGFLFAEPVSAREASRLLATGLDRSVS